MKWIKETDKFVLSREELSDLVMTYKSKDFSQAYKEKSKKATYWLTRYATKKYFKDLEKKELGGGE